MNWTKRLIYSGKQLFYSVVFYILSSEIIYTVLKYQSNLFPRLGMRKRGKHFCLHCALKELAFQINLKCSAASNLSSVMWVPLRTLWKAGGPWRGLVVLCFFFSVCFVVFFFIIYLFETS